MSADRSRAPFVSRSATALLAITAAVAACGDDAPGPPVDRDLAQIQEDTLVALVTYNATGYFIYRGTPMGFEYDLLRKFAEDNDLVLRPRVVRDRDQLFHMLNSGEGDVVAARVVPARRDEPHVAYSTPLYATRPAVVQRAEPADSAAVPEAVDTVLEPRDSVVAPQDPVRISARMIERPGGLAGREVHMPDRTFYEDRLVELSDSLSDEIHVVEVDSASHEALIRQLSRGEIELTISPENLALLKESYYTNVEVRPVVGPTHDVVFAVRSNADQLLADLNRFIEAEQDAGTVDELYRTYFHDRRGYQERIASEYLTSETGRLSEYDDVLRRHAPELRWDWRLLASQAYQESKFDPRARSWAGAMGILQLMPGTAREVGVSDPYDPEENVRGAVRYLQKMTEIWSDEIPEQDLRKFILASYNTGPGHVGDAQRLTEKNGGDPASWDDVSYWLLQKSRKEVYTDPVVKYGFSRGLEPVMYVKLILERYDHYQEFVVE